MCNDEFVASYGKAHNDERLRMMQAAAAADKLAANLDGERRAVVAYWEAVHQRVITSWQEAAGAVAAFPWRTDSLGLATYIGALLLSLSAQTK